ncbi:RNA cytosine-C(5)-methyltransferase NSUN2-like isoform X3 [Gordionus sp. m RMFG-2023]|uniref:RNA cytosine-C(5)-methyltransferase NSUN2-like isoform X3 n=1 Tax=Gordionus sp. m RMFG-2023 TaxID=3053472 RepID=UPI0031FD048C
MIIRKHICNGQYYVASLENLLKILKCVFKNVMGKRKCKRNFSNNKKRYEKFNEILKENKSFDEYYKKNLNFKDDEWLNFIQSAQSDLLATFHLTANDFEAKLIWEQLKEKFIKKIENEQMEIFTKLEWYTLSEAWQISASRKNIRKSEEFSNFHKILVAETEIGHFNRQEAVSLIPVQLMDIHSHHIILDMCASPGSKTTQILEILNAKSNLKKHLCKNTKSPQDSITDDQAHFAKGFVVANDSDSKRCYLLVHQTKRLRCPNLLIVNQDACFMPNLRYLSNNCADKVDTKKGESNEKDDKSHQVTTLSNEEGKNQGPLMYTNLAYDRILCDVPCTGDGTLRKNPLIWSKWTSTQANSIHQLQLRILKRGLELLKIGGYLVYSTCSLNPVENEAVISSMLKEAQDAIEIIDASEKLSGLLYVPGLTDWKVMSKNGVFYDTFKDVPVNMQDQLKETLFPPNDIPISDQLKKCIRIYPHLQNSGGFFVTLIRKNKNMPWLNQSKIHSTFGNHQWRVRDLHFPEKDIILADYFENQVGKEGEIISTSNENSLNDESTLETKLYANGDNIGIVEEKVTTQKFSRKSSHNKHCYKENPFLFMKQNGNALWDDIRKFFDFSPLFPVQNVSYRSEDKAIPTSKPILNPDDNLNGGNTVIREENENETIKHNLYFVHPTVRQIILLNMDRLKIINTGVRILAYNRSLKCDHPYRLCQDGISLTSNYIGARKIYIKFFDFIKLITHENVKMEELSEDTRKQTKDMGLGSICLVLQYNSKTLTESEMTNVEVNKKINAWLAPTSIRLFLNKMEIHHYAFMFGVPLIQKDREDKMSNTPDTLETIKEIE